MLRSSVLLAVALVGLALAFALPATGETILPKGQATQEARTVLMEAARAQRVKLKLSDTRATCTKDRVPNTYRCKLSERRKRCKGSTIIYAMGATGENGSRSTKVTCKRR